MEDEEIVERVIVAVAQTAVHPPVAEAVADATLREIADIPALLPKTFMRF